MGNKTTKERLKEAIKRAAIEQGNHPLQVIWEAKQKLKQAMEKRNEEESVKENSDKENVSKLNWHYKIIELDKYHFRIEYRYIGYFGKVENIIGKLVKFRMPSVEFYQDYKTNQWSELTEDLNKWIWDSFRWINVRESYKDTIIRRLENGLESFDYYLRTLSNEHEKNISSNLRERNFLFEKYIEIEDLEIITHRNTIFQKVQKGIKFKDLENRVFDEFVDLVSNLLIEKAITEYNEKSKRKLSLVHFYNNILIRLRKENSLWALFPEEEQKYLIKKQACQYLKQCIPADEEFYFRNVFLKCKATKIGFSDLPKNRFLLLSEVELGSINKIKAINGRPVRESFLCYEFTKIDCISGKAMHAYSIDENFKIQLEEKNTMKEYDGFGTLLFFFKDKLEGCYISSIRNYEHINEYWNFQIGSFKDKNIRKRFVSKYNSWWKFRSNILDSFDDNELTDNDVSIELYFPMDIESIPIWNNRVTNLKLSGCKRKLIPEANEFQNHGCWNTNIYYFKSGTLVHINSIDLIMHNRIIFDVDELKNTLLSRIKEEINFNTILKKLLEKDTSQNLLSQNPIFSVELARKDLTSVVEFDKKNSFEKNLLKFLNENKVSFLNLLLSDLFNNNMQNYTKEHQAHQFVVSKTIGFDNSEFGKLAEKEVYTYLLKYFDNYNWSRKFIVPVEFFPAFQLKIEWHNQKNESFLPYDISITSQLYDIKIDVKATRGGEDNIFYISIPELKTVLEKPVSYLIARVSMIEEGKKMTGIRLNSEMNLNFFQFKDETIELIKANLEEWENYYREKSVRFLVSHFEKNIQIAEDELNLSGKFKQYQNSLLDLIHSYFEPKVNVIINDLFMQTKKYSTITEDPSILSYFENNKNQVINQLCNIYGNQIRKYEIGKPR